MMHFELSKNEIRALLAVAPKNDVRHYLNGACIDADRQLAVATDGHMLLAFRARIAGSGRALIRRETLEQVAEMIARPAEAASFDVEGSTVTVYSNGMRIAAELIDGQFPDYDVIMPRSVSGELAQFDPHKIATLWKAFNYLANTSKHPGLVIAHNGLAAAIVGHAAAPDAIALLMPYRPEGIDLLSRMRSVVGLPVAESTDTPESDAA